MKSRAVVLIYTSIPLSRAEALELLRGSRQLEMLSTPPATELGKAADGEVGHSLVHRFFNPSPILHQYTLPPSVALGFVALPFP